LSTDLQLAKRFVEALVHKPREELRIKSAGEYYAPCFPLAERRPLFRKVCTKSHYGLVLLSQHAPTLIRSDLSRGC